MPIVFVHGVNNRDSPDYRDQEAARNGFLRELVAPALGLPSDELSIESPYWGGDAATFAWKMAVLPDASETYESFGSMDEAFGAAIELGANAPHTAGIVESAKKDLATTVDLVYGAALASAKTEQESRELARSYATAAKYAEDHRQPSWIKDAKSDAQFADLLVFHVSQEEKAVGEEEEAFGGGLLDRLKEGASRLGHAIPEALSHAAWRVARRNINAAVTRFAGDAFVYLKERGDQRSPGRIVDIVFQALRAGESRKKGLDDKLVVIAHSFGGEIVYDILTTFAPDLHVDCLITVGSQVGLFEEMKLYQASDVNVPPDPPKGRVAKPTNVKHWLNVYDANDVLSFKVAPVFADSYDYHYDTGYGTLQAHGGYFTRPSFYRRLAQRLEERLAGRTS